MTRGYNSARWTRFRFRVHRFGPGYWIGAVVTTGIAMLCDYASWPSSIGFTNAADVGLLFPCWTILAMLTIVGVVVSGSDLARAARERNDEAFVGAVLGLVLSSWPVAYALGVFAGLLHL